MWPSAQEVTDADLEAASGGRTVRLGPASGDGLCQTCRSRSTSHACWPVRLSRGAGRRTPGARDRDSHLRAGECRPPRARRLRRLRQHPLPGAAGGECADARARRSRLPVRSSPGRACRRKCSTPPPAADTREPGAGLAWRRLPLHAVGRRRRARGGRAVDVRLDAPGRAADPSGHRLRRAAARRGRG